MEKKVIEIVQGVTRHPLYRTKTPVDLCIRKGEQIAIVGENGSGKTRLVDIITGKLPLLRNEVVYDFSPSPYPLISDNIKSITFAIRMATMTGPIITSSGGTSTTLTSRYLP